MRKTSFSLFVLLKKTHYGNKKRINLKEWSWATRTDQRPSMTWRRVNETSCWTSSRWASTPTGSTLSRTFTMCFPPMPIVIISSVWPTRPTRTYRTSSSTHSCSIEWRSHVCTTAVWATKWWPLSNSSKENVTRILFVFNLKSSSNINVCEF